MNDWTSSFLSWLPFLVLIGVWLILSRVTNRGPSGLSIATLYEQQLAEMRRMNASLERIASVMEKRAQN
jgi:ATP-dependent Zn protease